MSMYIEIVSIITCRLVYLAFRPHRFVVGFGYGEAMTSTTLLVTSMFIEIIFEVVVDYFALAIEYKHGIDLSKFWEMWRMNAAAFWGLVICDGFASIITTIWAFKLIPNAIFCTSDKDPCSCVGGGFEIYKSLCNGNESSAWNETKTSNQNLDGQAQAEFKGIVDALGNDSTVVVVTVGVTTLIALIFVLARVILALAQAKDEKAEAETLAEELRQANIKIQDQLMLSKLNAEQVAIVEANSDSLDQLVPLALKLDWRSLVFEGRLGSGSFGDCYRGR